MQKAPTRIANYKYFCGVTTEVLLKAKFKELALVHHPDRGGSHEAFTSMKNEYDYVLYYKMFPVPQTVAQQAPNNGRNGYWSTAEDFDQASNQAFNDMFGSMFNDIRNGQNRAHQQRQQEAQQAEYNRRQAEAKARREAAEFERQRVADEARRKREAELDPDTIERLRANAFFTTARKSDFNFDLIDALFASSVGTNMFSNGPRRFGQSYKTENTRQERAMTVIREMNRIDGLTLDHFKYFTFLTGKHVSIATNLYRQYIMNRT